MFLKESIETRQHVLGILKTGQDVFNRSYRDKTMCFRETIETRQCVFKGHGIMVMIVEEYFQQYINISVISWLSVLLEEKLE